MAVLAAGLVGESSAVAQQRADVVRVPFPKEDGSLTPYTFTSGYPLVNMIYDTVMWRDANGVPQPWLAESVTREGRQVTIRLRPGIKWQDGSPLNASDVGFTFDFVRTHPHPRFSPQLTDVERVEVVDDLTVVITLKDSALGFFDQPLSDLPILPRHIWQNLPSGLVAPLGLPVGSGPYRLTGFRPGQGYTLEANPGYFRGAPLVDRLEVPIIPTAAKSLSALEDQKVDMLPAPLDSDAASQVGGLGVRIVTGDSYLGTVLMFNTARRPFNSLAARRAVAESIDLNRIADSLSGLASKDALPAENGYLHPDSPWAPHEDLHRFDEDAARVSFAELGLPTLRVLAANNNPERQAVGREVVAALQRAGAEAELIELPPRRLAMAVGQDRARANFDLAIWDAPPLASYDPAFLPAIFGDPATSRLNYSGYRSAKFNRRAADVAAAPDAESRKRAVAAELEQLANDVPVVPLVFPQGAFAYIPSAYDGWIYVKGEGILDKRSFLPDEAARKPDAAPIGSVVGSGDSGGGVPWLPLISVVIIVAVAALLLRPGTLRR